ncbi:nuclear transport factor 2 family protein [Paraferrimonas sedimenticola]|uniref:Transcriptional regulator n=1 Tax=Paraferrimonas sedimenticola TaxID=375674 RepID=A0AA37RX44_9GAMM|nr:nuclear transport factor 2 family protein [Paraferrimonas sedimenticola]GLP96964.1 transcriptional regulator [Paraferrimonas sedimenticola]
MQTQLQSQEPTEPSSLALKPSSEAVRAFVELYQNLDKEQLHQIRDVYSDDVEFNDGLHRVCGLDSLCKYFDNMFENVTACRFIIDDVIESGDQACVVWTMHYSHPQLNKGQIVEVPGSTHLRFGDKVHYHRDFMDLGLMLYEQIPLIGSVIKAVKRRAAAA